MFLSKWCSNKYTTFIGRYSNERRKRTVCWCTRAHSNERTTTQRAFCSSFQSVTQHSNNTVTTQEQHRNNTGTTQEASKQWERRNKGIVTLIIVLQDTASIDGKNSRWSIPFTVLTTIYIDGWNEYNVKWLQYCTVFSTVRGYSTVLRQ